MRATAYIKRETEQKWWLVLNVAVACRVCQEEGSQGLAVVLSRFLEAWHCANDWRGKYWFTPAVSILKYLVSERALTAIYSPLKEDKNVTKNTLTRNKREEDSLSERQAVTLYTSLSLQSDRYHNLTWLLNELICFRYAGFFVLFSILKFCLLWA